MKQLVKVDLSVAKRICSRLFWGRGGISHHSARILVEVLYLGIKKVF